MKYLFLFTSCFFFSCQNEVVSGGEEQPYIPSKEETAAYWREFSREESVRIDMFTERHNWNVIRTESGLRYVIYEKGEGEKAEPGRVAVVEFEVRLLDADTTLCYRSDKDDPVKFLIEQDYVESGLHEGITYMREGDRAMIILPHYLAHGLLGDEEKIPPASTVIYDIRLLKLED